MAPFGASPSFEVKSFDSDDNPSTPAKGGAISPRDPGVGPISSLPMISPIAEKDRLRGRERKPAGTDSAADAPLQFVLLLRLIPRHGPVVQRRGVVAAEAYRHAVVVLIPIRFRGCDAVFGEGADLVSPHPVRAGISGAQTIAGSLSATAPGVS
jgi:hypothetical protein